MTHTAAERGMAPPASPEPTVEHGLVAPRPRPAIVAALALAALLLAVHVGLAWRLRPLWIDVGDDATYVLLGRSLRSLAYRSIYLAGAPQHVQYPPGFPALLATIGAVLGERVAAFAAVQALLSAAALALVFDAARRRWSLQLALLLLAACAVNPLLVTSAPLLLSETPFLALCALSLWATARDGPSPRWLVLAVAAAIAAALTRTAGVALVVALLLTWCSERRWRAALVLLAAAVVVLGGWFVWTALAPRDALHYSYGADLARGYGGAPIPSTGVAAPAAAPAGALAGAMRGVVGRVVRYLTQIVPSWLPVPTLAHTRVDNVAWLGVIVGFGAAGVWALWRRWRAAALFLACYAAVLAAWPWALDRLLTPALPFVILALLAGIRLAAARWPGVLFERVVPVAFVGCLVATAATRDATLLRQRQRCLAAEAPSARGCLDPKRRSVFDAADYVRDHTSAGDTVLVFYGAGFYARAARVTLPIGVIAADADPRSGPRLAAGKYVLLTLTSWDERARTAAMRSHCDRLTLERIVPPAAMVLRTVDPATNPDSGRATCAALDQFLSAPWSDDANAP